MYTHIFGYVWSNSPMIFIDGVLHKISYVCDCVSLCLCLCLYQCLSLCSIAASHTYLMSGHCKQSASTRRQCDVLKQELMTMTTSTIFGFSVKSACWWILIVVVQRNLEENKSDFVVSSLFVPCSRLFADSDQFCLSYVYIRYLRLKDKLVHILHHQDISLGIGIMADRWIQGFIIISLSSTPQNNSSYI